MDAISAKILAFAMVLARVSGFFLIVPVFSWETVPVRLRVAAVLLLSIFFSALAPSAVNLRETSAIEAVILIAGEATYGLAIGLIINILFSAVKLGGNIIEQEMGLSMAEILDPLTGEPAQPLSGLLEMIFIILFLSANGHHFLLSILHKSYAAFPPGRIPTVPIMLTGIIDSGSAMLAASLRLAAPMLAASMLVVVALAIFARIVPEMDVFFISFPLRIGLGIFMVVAILPFINGFVAEFAKLMLKLVPL